MYKKHCLIKSILLITHFFATAMDVEGKKEQLIHINTSNNVTFTFSPNSPLFSQSATLKAMVSGKYKEKGTVDNQITLSSIDDNQLKFIQTFIVRKKYPEELKYYLENLNTDDLSKLIVASDFLGVQEILKPIVSHFEKKLQAININALNKLIMKKELLNIEGISELIVPYLVKQLKNPNLLNKWLEARWNELLTENKCLSDCTKQYLTHNIKRTSQDLQQKKSIVLKGHKYFVSSVAYGPNSAMLASGSTGNTVKLWNVKRGKEIRTLLHGCDDLSANSLAFSPDGTMIVSKSFWTKLWDVKTGRKIRTFTGHKGRIQSVAFSPDGTMIALSKLRDKTIKLWDVKTGEKIHTLTGHENSASSLAFSPDGTMLVSGSWDKTIKLWDVKTGKIIHTLTGHKNSVCSIIFSPDGTMLVSGSWDETIKLWGVETGKIIHTLTGHKDWVTSVKFSPDGTMIASISEDDGTTKLWDVKTGKEIRYYFHNQILALAFSPDGTMLASSELCDKTIKLWDVKTGKIIHTLTGHKNGVYSLAFTPDGTMLAGSFDNTIGIWRLINLKEIKKLSVLELLLIHSLQHAKKIKTLTYPELNKIYGKASGPIKKIIKTLTPYQGFEHIFSQGPKIDP